MTAATNAEGRVRDAAPLVVLGALLVVAAAIRIPAIGLTGHVGDVLVISGVAERMADVGPLRFYESGGGSVYPALLYPYWLLGTAFNGDALGVAIKAMAIPFDLAVGLLLFWMTAWRAGRWAGTAAAALYLLNPAVILAGPVWGQIDAAGTLFMLGALFAASAARLGLGAALAVLAGLVKPQFGLVLLPVLVLGALEWRRTRSPWPMAYVLVSALAAYAVVTAPLLLNPAQHVGNVMYVSGIRTEASVHAPNMWALAFGYEHPDTGLTVLGTGLMLAGLVAAQLPLLRNRDLRTLLSVGSFVVFAFYFLPTRVHERYLFPAMGTVAPLAAVSASVLGGYLALTAGFALSMLYALADTTPFPLPPQWEEVLLAPFMVPVLSVLMIVAGATLVVQLATGAGSRLAGGPRA
ncbi:MAG TPA: hypothetical protein VHK63_09055 [Candidatus Limnocylindria bacterium]|nr:hypothetical protein [Candidatus Limnocylindria bacterium]